VEITNTHVWATQQRRIVRWDRPTYLNWANDSATYQGTTFAVAGTGELSGITVCGGRVFVSDPGAASNQVVPDTSTVKALSDSTGAVLNTWAVPRARHLSCDRQGNVWVLQQRTPTATARLSRYSPIGASLGGFNVSGEPMDVAANPNADEVLVADNGTDQRVERYGYSGALVGTLGVSYLSGTTPGLLGPTRFAGVRGVDVDSSGNIYVLQSFGPGRGTEHWRDNELGDTAVFSKHQPNGTQVWRRMGIIGMPGEANPDKSRIYVNNVTYARQADGRYEPRALNLNGFSNDPAYGAFDFDHRNTAQTTMYREFGGHRWLFKAESRSRWYRLYRLDGELRTLAASWGNVGNDDMFMTATGDVWRPLKSGAVHRLRLTGVTNGVPSFSAQETLPTPPGFTRLERMEVHGNSIYVMGYGAGAEFETGRDDFLWSGKRLARFDFTNVRTATSWPAPRWSVNVLWGAYPDRPASMSVDGDRVALGYFKNSDRRNQGYVRLHNALTGAFITRYVPPLDYGEMYGAFDMYRSITYKDGLIGFEGNGQAKSILLTP
jgi:hypothetical protein